MNPMMQMEVVREMHRDRVRHAARRRLLRNRAAGSNVVNRRAVV